MATLEKESVGSMLVHGNGVPVITKMMEQDKLRFYPENPRVYSILRSGGKTKPSQEDIEKHLQRFDHVKELREEIKGLLEPLIAKAGTLEVLEGNSRLAAYGALAAKEPLKWNVAKCTLLPEDIDESLILALLGRYHVNGKKSWAPYEQAGFLYRRFHNHNVPTEDSGERGGFERQGSESRYRGLQIHGRARRENHRPLELLLRVSTINTIRKARSKHPELDSIIVEKIKSEEISKAMDLRDQLPTICATPKVLTKFVNNSGDFAKAYTSAVSAGGDNTTLNQIKKFLELITRADTESGLLEGESRVQEATAFELRKIEIRLRALLLKLQA